MAIHIESKLFKNKSEADAKERLLRDKGFIRVPPTAKKKPGQYSRSEIHRAEASFEEIPTKYTIEWCSDQ